MTQARWVSIPAVPALIALVMSSVFCSLPASADTAASPAATGTVAGLLVSLDNGLPIQGAKVELEQGSTVVASTTSNGDGEYSFAGQPAGLYSVAIHAFGYEPTLVTNVSTAAGLTTTLRTALLRARTGSGTGSLREIASVSSTANGGSLAATTTIQHDLDPQQLLAQGYLKSADALGQLPGVDIEGGPHTVGDDTSIDIRGMGPGEVRPLIDGHPIGPIGVGSTDYYDYANSPFSLLNNVQVTVGSGAEGLYGIDVIGGTIDLQTLNPTLQPHGTFVQGIGEDGTLLTIVSSTGSVGKLGYAVGHAVTGTYGDFAPEQSFQGARPNNNENLPNGGACVPSSANPNPNLTSCNSALNTYSVSSNYRVQNDLGKLKYNFSNVTSLTFAAYAANQLSDSTGNGDNDNLPYATRLAEIKAQPTTCSGGYLAVTNSNPNACLGAAQLASLSYGPDGGGEDRNRGTSLQDYHARFNTSLGSNEFTADFFRDYYNFRKNSNEAAGLDPTGSFFIGGGTYEDEYLTDGFLLSDDIASEKNDLGFGYYVEHQRVYGNDIDVSSNAANVYSVSFTPQPQFGEGDYSFFLREQYIPSSHFAVYANAWDRRSNVTEKTTLDPRLSLVYKPTHNDVVRVTGGRADGDPAPEIKALGPPTGVSNASSLNPSCTLLNSIATGGNPNLQPEAANDLEAAYGHRFWSDTAVNVVAYVTSERNRLFSAVEPITAYGPLATDDSVIDGELSEFATKINAACGTAYTAATVLNVLGVSTTYNAASSLYRGIELNGRIRATPSIYADFSYDIESAESTGIPLNVLATNPFLINGGQLYGIPVHKASVTFDYNDLHGAEAQIEGFYVGNNNDLNRPAYTFFNGFVTESFGHGIKATLGATNLFNQNSQVYGYFGEQLPAATNAFAPTAPAGIDYGSPGIKQAVALGNGTQEELFGLQPRILIFQLSEQI